MGSRPGSMIDNILAQQQKGVRLAVLLMDESHDGIIHNENKAQSIVLETSRSLGLPLLVIEINIELKNDPRGFKIQTHRSFLMHAHKVINKPSFNAFSEFSYPNLLHTLQTMGVSPPGGKLVVMGYDRELCVRLSAVGGEVRPGKKPVEKGATTYGYSVITCSEVLRSLSNSPDASWSDEPGVEYYERL